MTPKQKLVKIFKKHDYTEEYNRYVTAHANNPVYFPSFKQWLAYTATSYSTLKGAIEKAGYKSPNSDRTWTTAIQVYAQVGSSKKN